MSESTGRSAPAWREVLDRIEVSLEQWLRLAPSPDEAAERAPLEPPVALGKLDERLGLWQACLDQAESSAGGIDGELADEQAALVDWLERAGKARELLSEAARNHAG